MASMSRNNNAGSSASCRNRIRLLERATRRTIRGVRAGELERSPTIVAARRIELRGMIREREQVSLEKLFEARPGGVKLGPGLFEPSLRPQHVRKTPPNLRIAGRTRRCEQCLRVGALALARTDFRQVYARLHIGGYV